MVISEVPSSGTSSERARLTGKTLILDVNITTKAKYLAIICFAALAIAIVPRVGRDHFASIPNAMGLTWYCDLSGDTVSEFQDQDIFFHNIGSSIEDLKRADIVMVGSSLVAFALDHDVIKNEIKDRFGLNFYNLSFVGVTNGDFSKLILEKYSIKPKILIINADDGGGGGSFFSRGLLRRFGAASSPIPSTEYGLLHGFQRSSPNLRWRFEGFLKDDLGSSVLVSPGRFALHSFFRDAQTGMYDMTDMPPFNLRDNPSVSIKMPQARMPAPI
jgi:hypothetical protein